MEVWTTEIPSTLLVFSPCSSVEEEMTSTVSSKADKVPNISNFDIYKISVYITLTLNLKKYL